MYVATYRVAQHVSETVAPDDDDLVIFCRQNIGGGRSQPIVVVQHPLCGWVVALPGDPRLEPGLAVGDGELDHLEDAVEQLGGASHGGAVEQEAAMDRTLWLQAERIRDLDVTAPCCTAGAPCALDDIHGGGGEHPHGRRNADKKKPKPYELHLHASACTS